MTEDGPRMLMPDPPTGSPIASQPDRGLRVAVVDLDTGFVQVLVKRLEESDSESWTRTAAPPLHELVALRLHALIVDPACLGPDAWPFLERVCDALPDLAVLVCTGPSTVAQRVRGLRLGVDDWMNKPCHPLELIARIEATTRRHRRANVQLVPEPLVVGELRVRRDHFQAFVGATPAELTRREFEVLELLIAAEGRVLPREEIYRRVWGYAMARGDRSVDVFVRKIRHKLGRLSPAWSYIHTHFGVGYRFDPQRKEAAPASPESERGTTPEPAPIPAALDSQRATLV